MAWAKPPQPALYRSAVNGHLYVVANNRIYKVGTSWSVSLTQHQWGLITPYPVQKT